MASFINKLQGKVQKHLGASHSSPAPVGTPHNQGGTPPFPIDRPDDPLPLIPQPGQHQPGPGQLPPRVAKTTYWDRHQFFHTNGHRHSTLRDLGFSGVLDGKIVWSWGDTLMGEEGCNPQMCAVDSTSIGSMGMPMCSMDTAVSRSGNVSNWIPTTPDEEKNGGYSCFSFGGTNIVEVAPNKGVVYYLKMHRPGGVYNCRGAGVCECSMGPGSVPKASRPFDTLWNELEPCWGDVGVALDARDGMLYAYGHGTLKDDELGSRTYLCRCPKDRALDINSYEYWLNDQKKWTKQRLANGQMGTLACTKEMAIFDWHAMNQSAPFWSNYFNKWMFLHSTGWPSSDVYCKTADKLEGPWDDHGVVATTKPEGHGEGMRYCVTGHPQFDPSGKTVLVTWTRNNVIWGVTIEWA